MCICKVCGKTDYVIDTKKFPKDFCSYRCYEEWQKWNKTPNCECAVCKRKMYIKPSRLKRVKNGITCSKECANKLKSEYMQGERNHQFGLIGDKNASFKGECIESEFGYILEYCPGHPYPHDSSNNTTRVFQHRLVIERNSDKFDDIYFEVINGWKVLKPIYEVHHINEIRTDNRLENLQIVTKGEHRIIHNNKKEILRDSLGRIIGVVKQGELLENPEVDNQQPSQPLTKLEGSETNS